MWVSDKLALYLTAEKTKSRAATHTCGREEPAGPYQHGTYERLGSLRSKVTNTIFKTNKFRLGVGGFDGVSF